MILILDACTISNLFNAYQDASLIKLCVKCFDEIYVCQEVINEVDRNKFANLSLYSSRAEVLQLLSELQLNKLISPVENLKSECIPFFRRFAQKKGMNFREDEGEFHSSLLSLYLSRWGKENYWENTNRILFATDDLGAKELYQELFASNQIGCIVDSLDLVTIFHIKSLITRSSLINYIQAVYALYYKEVSSLKLVIEGLKKLERDTRKQLLLTELMHDVSNGDIQRLDEKANGRLFRSLLKDHPVLKSSLSEVTSLNWKTQKQKYLKHRQQDLQDDLLWNLKV